MATVETRNRIRRRPKSDGYIDVVMAYDDVTGQLQKYEIDQRGFDGYDIELRLRRAGRDDDVTKGRGGRPAIDLRGKPLRLRDGFTRRGDPIKQPDGWGVVVRVTAAAEIRRKRKQGLSRGRL